MPNEIPTPDRHPTTVPIDHQYEIALANEECGEVCQLVGKALRFGWSSHHPDDPTQTNYDLLHNELGDVEAAIEFGVERGAFDRTKIERSKQDKLKKLRAVAPPPMYVTSGSTIALHRKPPNESGAAIIVMVILLVLIAAAATFGYFMGARAAQETAQVQAAKAEVTAPLVTKETYQQCVSRKISAIVASRDVAKPADLAECDRLAR